jgi:hypothetical protein
MLMSMGQTGQIYMRVPVASTRRSLMLIRVTTIVARHLDSGSSKDPVLFCVTSRVKKLTRTRMSWLDIVTMIIMGTLSTSYLSSMS